MRRGAVSLFAVCSLAVSSLAAPSARADVSFSFPSSEEHRPLYYVTAYRDLSGPGNGLEDWGCGSITYDGHGGTDLGAGGFAGMDEGRDVTAAADGVVSFVNDGAFDRCTTADCPGGGGFGNYVRIDHADGKVTYYGHLKKFSIPVSVGDEVSCGQKIGEMGSSGRSTGPHLHFEPRVDGVSDDPFSGPCGGPISWWGDQGEYDGLPALICQDAAPAHPRFAMAAELDGVEGEGAAEAAEVEVEQEVVARFFLTADPSEATARDVVIGLDAPGELLTILDWQVFDDFEDNACGGEMCPNDANEHPMNPPRELPGERFDLHLYALSPGETKMVELTLRPEEPSAHAPVRAWLKEVPGTYAKEDFDAEPDNVDEYQTFNGGDLKQELLLDLVSAGEGTGAPADPSSGATDLAGGCAAAGASGPGVLSALLLALALALPRRRRSGRPVGGRG